MGEPRKGARNDVHAQNSIRRDGVNAQFQELLSTKHNTRRECWIATNATVLEGATTAHGFGSHSPRPNFLDSERGFCCFVP